MKGRGGPRVTIEHTDKRIKIVIIGSYVLWAWSVLVLAVGASLESETIPQYASGLWLLSFFIWVGAKAYRYWHHG